VSTQGAGRGPDGPGPRAFAARVIAWQRSHGRHGLPWQASADPYRRWLSEVMLQQTQVTTVLGYYDRFLARFPDVAALAAAPLDEVLALWSGLGYYSRARNLHRCAQAVVARHGGQFPRTAEQLATLPGIGRSTAAAIAAFCHGERAAILDGNVKRVLARAFGVADDLARGAGERTMWARAQALLPETDRPDLDLPAYTQGLMDLGATVCTARRPDCARCPLADGCVARAEGQPTAYPVKSRRSARGRRASLLLWLTHQGRLWLAPRPPTGVWGGLWSLPELPEPGAADALAALTAGWPGQAEPQPAFVHVLTHRDWTLQPVRWALPDDAGEPVLQAVRQALAQVGAADGRWLTPDEARASGLPAPVRRLLDDAPDAITR
jgi:A/G-specific adenine glycosylase